MQRTSRRSRDAQRGMATLAIALIFLVSMTAVVFFASRNLIFEQKTSANQTRATKAFEAAEAGVEWALANLNNQSRILAATCLVDPAALPANQSFRDRIATIASTLVVTPTGRSVACVRTATGLDCNCPDAGNPAPAAGDGPSFQVAFSTAPLLATGTPQPRLMQIVATGCDSRGSQCIAGGSASDATAQVRILAGVVPMMINTPASPLTACLGVDLSNAAAGMVITNVNQEVGGVTVNSGGTYSSNTTGINLNSVPGSPDAASIYRGDASLAAICPATTGQESSMFFAFFGMTKDDFKAMTESVKTFSCTTAADCETKLSGYIAQGWQYFYITSDLVLSSNTLTLGTLQKPVAIVVGGPNDNDGDASLTGSIKINGLIYTTDQAWNDTAGDTFVRGAVLAEGNFAASGSMTLLYDKDLLDLLGNAAGPFARVPGSWRDSTGQL